MRWGPFFVLLAACGRGGAPRAQVWHTFDADEAPTLAWALGDAPVPAVARPVPFERAHNVLRAALARGGEECPDVARVDAAWIPGLAEQGLIREAPADLGGGVDAVVPAARALAESGGKLYGIAETYGCLAVIEPVKPDAPPQTLDELERRMAGYRRPGQPVDVRDDGFAALPWIFAEGGDLFDPAGPVLIDGAAAERALARLARLAALGAGDSDGVARFARGDIAVLIDGPWALRRVVAGIPAAGLRVEPFPRGPDGRPSAPVVGQVWVVGSCSRDAAAAWRLVEHLVSDRVADRFAETTFALPARRTAAEHATPLVKQFSSACPLRLLPRHPLSAAMFEDLTPAVSAVLSGRASPAEALADVALAWRRLIGGPGGGATAPDGGLGAP